jgi:protein-S-isoprenylcysteine O-methyltransferase Ste14/uncharacterized membrane protein
MSTAPPAYGLWALVVINSAVFILFALSFAKPQSPRDWRSFGAFSGFIVALFTEMYGFPLTVYLLSGWLQRRYPGLDLLSHDAGHLWWTLLGLRGDPHRNVLHIASILLIGGGFVLLSAAWSVLYRTQRLGQLATSGPYARVRHPQYVAFIVIMLGFLLQWPTVLTLAMFPLLVGMYVRLARAEEREVRRKFGDAYDRYAAATPGWVPRLGMKGGGMGRLAGWLVLPAIMFVTHSAEAQERVYEWHWGMHPMWGVWGLGMMLMMLVFWAVLITGIVLGIRWLSAQGREPRRDAALATLRERCARGEINREEFEARKQDLTR